MQDIESILSELGLTQTEATVYLAGLARSSIGVQELVTGTRIKRPTVYHALETLMQKGLVSKHGTARRLEFVMTKPRQFEHLVDREIGRLQEQKQKIISALPLLEARLSSESGNGVKVSQFDGIDGVKTVVEEALYCKSRRWDILAPRRNFFSDFDPAYRRYFLKTREDRGIVARSLWEKGTAEYDRLLTAEEIGRRNPRYLPEALHGKFESLVILFDNKAAIITSLKTHSAVLIESEETYHLLSAMFEGLWSVATPYRKSV
ncbi:MAG: helix-turn-helix domain-containing protein [Patescibacteria group bacterium]